MTKKSLKSWVAVGASALLAASGLALANTAAYATAAPQPASASDAPHQWLTGYWHNFDNGSTVLKLSDVPSAYNLVAVAFAENDRDLSGGITFDVASDELDGYTDAEFKSDIDDIHADGRKVILSVGGEKGNVLINSTEAAQNFADSAYDLMQEYGFDGIDIDLEHGIDSEHISSALHTLRSKVGSELIITMAPQTIDYQYEGEYWKLTENIADILTIVNMQFYNSGAMQGCDDQVYSQGSASFIAALACIEIDDVGLSPEQVGIGVPAVDAAAGGGYLSASKVVDAVDCLENGTSCGSFTPTNAEGYGPIGGAMTWSVNWDATNNYQFASTLSKRLNVDGAWEPSEPGDGDGDGDSTDPGDGDGDGDHDGDGDSTDPGDGDGDGDGDHDGDGDGDGDHDGDGDSTDPGDSTQCDATEWDSGAVYNGGDHVAFDGHEWKAGWWTQGAEPGTTGEWGVWSDLGTCDDADDSDGTDNGDSDSTDNGDSDGTDNGDDAGDHESGDSDSNGDSDSTTCSPEWVKGTVYLGDDEVSYEGVNYTASWWTNSDAPGSSQWGPWEKGEACV